MGRGAEAPFSSLCQDDLLGRGSVYPPGQMRIDGLFLQAVGATQEDTQQRHTGLEQGIPYNGNRRGAEAPFSSLCQDDLLGRGSVYPPGQMRIDGLFLQAVGATQEDTQQRHTGLEQGIPYNGNRRGAEAPFSSLCQDDLLGRGSVYPPGQMRIDGLFLQAVGATQEDTQQRHTGLEQGIPYNGNRRGAEAPFSSLCQDDLLGRGSVYPPGQMRIDGLFLQAVGATQEDTQQRPTGLRQLIHYNGIRRGAEAPFSSLCQDDLLGRGSVYPPGQMRIDGLFLQAVGATQEDTQQRHTGLEQGIPYNGNRRGAEAPFSSLCQDDLLGRGSVYPPGQMRIDGLFLQAVGATQEDTQQRPTGLRQLIHYNGIRRGAEAPFSSLCQDDLLGRGSVYPPGQMRIDGLFLQAVGATQEDTQQRHTGLEQGIPYNGNRRGAEAPFSSLCQDDLLGRGSVYPPGQMRIDGLFLQAVGATQEDTQQRPTGLRQLIHYNGIRRGAEAPFSSLCQDDLLGRGSVYPPGQISSVVLVLQAVGATVGTLTIV